jgi:fumarylacetoacetate (FAA) hydrolase family protein
MSPWSDEPDDLLRELERWDEPGGPTSGRLIGRVHLPAGACPRGIGGPTPVLVREGVVLDLTGVAPTVADLLEGDDLVAVRAAADLPVVGPLAEVIAASHHTRRRADEAHLLAPFDLQVVRACGVTFATSLIERVIEEGARGDAAEARRIRERLAVAIGSDLAAIEPGSARAAALKAELIAAGRWSQYLEVGIGPDPEIFTKAPVLASVGTGQQVGVRGDSAWNNPEPEVVLAVDSRGRIRGATLGNDVNLRDMEGRSALLLGEAKDNNASCAIGAFIRLFDEPGSATSDPFTLETLMAGEVALEVSGQDGFETAGANRLSEISRPPRALVNHAMGARHQYPDGLALFLGTMFVPTADRLGPGSGFTHRPGDRVTIRERRLGSLVNWVGFSESLPRWDLGIRGLMANLAARGLLQQPSGDGVH